jgi:hypothetical protein
VITNPLVFNWRYYLYANPDLIQYGLITKAQAEQHWSNSGIYEGRQAHPSFHSLQYMQRYDDLLKAFWYNYKAATLHYITNGNAEGRIGHMTPEAHGDPMGAYGRITVTSKYTGDANSWSNPVTVTCSKQFAGAIESIQYKNFEFVNSYDHGRQAQFAWQYGSSPAGTPTHPTFDATYAERFNPTEAGNEADAVGYTTSAVLSAPKFTHANVLDTTCQPAYWKQAADSQGAYTNVKSKDTLRKVVVVSPNGIPRLTRISAFVTPEQGSSKKAVPTRHEVPSLYINPELDTFWQADAELTQLTQIPNAKNPRFSNTVMWDGNPMGGWFGSQGGEVPGVVIASGVGKAIGVYVVPSPAYTRISYQAYFQNYQVASTTPINRTRSMGPAVYVADGSKYVEFTTYIAVGDTPQEVLNTLRVAAATKP